MWFLYSTKDWINIYLFEQFIKQGLLGISFFGWDKKFKLKSFKTSKCHLQGQMEEDFTKSVFIFYGILILSIDWSSRQIALLPVLQDKRNYKCSISFL